MEEIKALKDEEMTQASGGVLANCPKTGDLKRMGLDGIVCNPEGGVFDTFYDTKRDNGQWKHVGSEDMLRYVERTLGVNDPRYQALKKFSEPNDSEWGIDP